MGIFQAVYTAGVKLPIPISTATYYHRPLNYKKLLECRFCAPSAGKSPDAMEDYYDLHDIGSILGVHSGDLVSPTPEDYPAIAGKLNCYLSRFDMHVKFSESDAHHWLGSVEGVVFPFVRRRSDGEIVDFVSFYSIPTTVIGSDRRINVAYLFYYFAESHASLTQLICMAMLKAKALGFDVFNALDILDNNVFLTPLRFSRGDGSLHYYLFNWRTSPIDSKRIGLLLF